jgi:hypothetical protein
MGRVYVLRYRGFRMVGCLLRGPDLGEAEIENLGMAALGELPVRPLFRFQVRALVRAVKADR